jgi:hypothetical protein
VNLENQHNKQQPFGVPANYFESFQDTLDARLAEERLRDYVKGHGFKAPEGYLDNFTVKVKTQTDDGNTKVISLFNSQSIAVVAAIAACIVLVFTVFNNDSKQDQFAIEDIPTNTLENYLQSDAIQFTNDELTAYLSEEAFSLSQTTIEEEIANEALEDYIIDNLDATDLYIQYEE